MRTLAGIAVYATLLIAICFFGLVFNSTAFVVAFGLVPFLIGATAAVCSRKWGARAVWIGLVMVLLPSGWVIFRLPTTDGAKIAGVLAVFAIAPFFGALLLAKLAEGRTAK